MRIIGQSAGAPEHAARLVADIRRSLDAVRQRTSGRPRRTVLFIVGRSPGRLDGMVAVGKGSFLNGLIEIAGGVNALAGTPLGYPKISLEGVLAMNPDVIIDMGDMADVPRVTREHQREVAELWGSRPSLKAVKARQLYAVASEIFVVAGPRMAQTAEAFEKMIHPEAAR
jgi:iron complex transport system substrate-binding protein